MVFIPEAFDYISENKEMCLSLAHSVDGPIIQDLSQTAKNLNVWLSLGGFHEKVCNVNYQFGVCWVGKFNFIQSKVFSKTQGS